MTKYYYDCPIKAAYMAKEFGVKFKHQITTRFKVDMGFKKVWDKRKETVTVSSPRSIVACLADSKREQQHKKFYVHPDSEYIFKPQEGDLVAHYDPETHSQAHGWDAVRVTKTLTADEQAEYEFEEGSAHTMIYAYDEELYACEEIIQRDNKAFISPEVE